MKKIQFSSYALEIFKVVFDGEDDTFVRLSDLRETFSEEAGYKPGIREARIIKELQALLRMSA